MVGHMSTDNQTMTPPPHFHERTHIDFSHRIPPDADAHESSPSTTDGGGSLEMRVSTLEQEVTDLKIAALRRSLRKSK